MNTDMLPLVLHLDMAQVKPIDIGITGSAPQSTILQGVAIR